MSGKELKQRRENFGLTQGQLAKELSVAGNTVARWERDERAIPTYLDLALKSIALMKLKEYFKATSDEELKRQIQFDFDSIPAWENYLETRFQNDYELLETPLNTIELKKRKIEISDNEKLREAALIQFKIMLGIPT